MQMFAQDQKRLRVKYIRNRPRKMWNILELDQVVGAKLPKSRGPARLGRISQCGALCPHVLDGACQWQEFRFWLCEWCFQTLAVKIIPSSSTKLTRMHSHFCSDCHDTAVADELGLTRWFCEGYGCCMDSWHLCWSQIPIVITLQETNISHLGKSKNHLQICLIRGIC